MKMSNNYIDLFLHYQLYNEMNNHNKTIFEKDKHNIKVFIHYQKSAELGNSDGIFQVGNCYLDGIGVKKDKNKAFIYYQKSSKMGHIKGMHNLGCCFQNGIGINNDEYIAFIYYQKSAELDDIYGTFNVGQCYRYGIGTERDKHKAFIYYQKSSNMGLSKGIFNLGIDLKPLQMLLSECNDILQRWANEKEKYSQKPLYENSEEEVIFKKDENKMSNTCPKFIEAGNIEETDKSERIGVEKDEEKEDSNKTRILAELNNVKCGLLGSHRQKKWKLKQMNIRSKPQK
ncbi:hypothetical protein C2G38_2315644 [Gigaspora rosea]|uniref:HCP-like protein n=1 Tax=Gigaspora rosea TaxID=44941 RepID=A0A397V9Z0_9GLOM|nr:hypothetical protein C2G38_2315644 [Gigaspora rosea]